MKKLRYVPILVLPLLLAGCLTPAGDKAAAALGEGVKIVKDVHFEAAMSNEDLRCKRPIELVLRMADARGEAWLNAYIATCPQVQELIKRIAGAAALSQGFKLVPGD